MNVTLQGELYHKISLLLDKPISAKSTQQIINHIKNELSNKQKIFNLLLSKFRSDLIIFMLKSYQFAVNFISQSIKNLIKNISEYEVQPLKQIWKIFTVFLSQSKQKCLYQYSFEEILKEGLKVTNLQKKNMLFQILRNNIQILHELGEKGLIMAIQSIYIQIFKKFQINVPFYVATISTIVKINNQTQKIAHQKQQVQVQKLPQIYIQDRVNLINQIKIILTSTKSKPMHQLHKECLLSLTQIYTYNSFQYKDLNNIYETKRLLQQDYLYRKSTRDESRTLMNIVQSIQIHIKKQNKEKAIKQYSQILQKSDDVLIQNVVNRTNQYLAKYKVKNLQKQQNSMNELMGKSVNLFLKKGEGVGGGKTYLQSSPTKSKPASILKGKDKFDMLLQECLNNSNSNKQRQMNSEEHRQIQIQSRKQNLKVKELKQLDDGKSIKNNKQKYEVERIGQSQSILVERYQNQKQKQRQYDLMSSSNTTVDLQDRQDEQINQVNQLIDLAYSYKFSV